MNEPIVLWMFLNYSGNNGTKEKVYEEKMVTLNKPLESFVEAVNNVCDISISQFLKPCVKRDRLSIVIPEEEYLLGVEACKHNLHGRVIWPKGSSLLTF